MSELSLFGLLAAPRAFTVQFIISQDLRHFCIFLIEIFHHDAVSSFQKIVEQVGGANFAAEGIFCMWGKILIVTKTMARESHLIFCEIESSWLPLIKWLKLQRQMRVFRDSCELEAKEQFLSSKMMGEPLEELEYCCQALTIAETSSTSRGEASLHFRVVRMMSSCLCISCSNWASEQWDWIVRAYSTSGRWVPPSSFEVRSRSESARHCASGQLRQVSRFISLNPKFSRILRSWTACQTGGPASRRSSPASSKK